MTELLSTAVLVIGAAVLLALVRRRDPARVSQVVWVGFFAHVVAAFGQVYVTRSYYGGGDMIGYYEVGRALAQLLGLDPQTYVPELIDYFFRQRVALPIGQVWEGSSTGSMAALSTLVVFLTGESLTSACMLVALLSFFAKLSLYDVFLERIDRRLAFRAGVAMLLVPSAVYWSSGLLKETVAVSGAMAALAGAYRVRQGRLWSLPIVVIGALVAAMVKPYIIFPIAAAATVWAYWNRAIDRTQGGPVRLRPVVVALGLGSAMGVVVVLGRLFPDYSMDRLAEQAAAYQEAADWSVGGSTIDVGDPSEQSLAGQLAFVPIALVNVLFRPFAFEVRNAMMAINAVETTLITILAVVALVRHRVRMVLDHIMASPELVFCLVLVLTMSVGVGLTTTNLGTLSRYRMPLMPFYAFFVLTLSSRLVSSLPSREQRMAGAPRASAREAAVRSGPRKARA